MTGATETGSGQSGWDGILADGEMVVWQGKPSRRLRIGRVDMARTGMGLVFVVFAIFWISQTAPTAGSGMARVFSLAGLLFLAIGLYNAGGHLVWRGFKHRFTTYTLSDRRAFIATNLPLQGRRLQSHPIAPDAAVALEDGEPGSVWFAHRHVGHDSGSRRVPVGFENISAPRAVYDLVRLVQRGAA
ncbi:aspartate carbamoyltransferase catalytic subunit [Thalassococcus sp. CAU 1522]|uniref:Aspartate carbamoyltransferase catalytic subunit n=1 Tax=Thalassococcus arenae TaxID=2851652 RepID=A0ABS6N4X5_9RHOB|nr:aspartate carbamoyltransferase catalytic subunit [Thalassococcus arenae]MBV2359066.1 aspartate carbamoyltransferase catalytic subunit [Thalassococcus arenae]